MSAPDLELLPLSEEELNPHVLVVTGNVDLFEPYKEHIESCGFPCEVYTDIQDVFTYVHSRAGAVVFFSWDLPNTNVKAMVSILTANLGVDCIVFAESDDVQSRAMMASCGFKQTIQPPYNEKNFAMAVKKIASDRHVENEKRLRKMRHHERFLKSKTEQDQEMSAEDILMQLEKSEDDSSSVHFSSGSDGSKSGMNLIEGEFFPDGSTHVHGRDDSGGIGHFQSNTEKNGAVLHKGEERKGKLHLIDGEKKDSEVRMFRGRLRSEERSQTSSFDPRSAEGREVPATSRGQTDSPEENISYEHSPSDGHAGSWKEVDLPSLPQVAEAPRHLSKKHRSRLKEKSSLSGFDWLLLICGSVIGLGLCAYILAQVFILPYLN